MPKTEFDLCVIGGGSGGLVAAAGAATLGAKVALVEKHRLGGDCLWTGCVPSKALLQTAKVAHLARTAHRYGLPGHSPRVDIGQVMDRVNSVIAAVEVHDNPQRFRDMGIEVIFGAGRFTDPHVFEVDGRRLTAKNFVIATGSRPGVPPIAGLADVPFLTNEAVFTLREPVPRLLVLGGGPIGVEMAQAFARLGSEVTLIERGPQLLPVEDRDAAAVVERRLRAEGVNVLLDSETLEVSGQTGDLQLTFKQHASATLTVNGSHLLLATGRRANSEGLGLDAAGVRLDERSYIRTDPRLRTTAKHIYACGDVTGPYLFTHMAEHQAGVVLRNALFHLPAKVEQRVIPWCTYSDPEVARVGLSENQARRQGVAHQVYTFPFHDIDRAQTDGETDGFAKIITGPQGKLLGATLVGPHAGELIHEYVLALANGMKAKDLSGVIHIYPTLAQINRRVADQHLKAGLTPRAKKWLKRIFRLRGK